MYQRLIRVPYERPIQAPFEYLIINGNQLTNQAWQRHSATPSKTLNRAIRNLSSHFYQTLATQKEAYYDDLTYQWTDCRKTPLLQF